jgi:hypothetical protein
MEKVRRKRRPCKVDPSSDSMIPLRSLPRMGRGMNPVTPATQLPRIIAISALVLVVLLSLALP